MDSGIKQTANMKTEPFTFKQRLAMLASFLILAAQAVYVTLKSDEWREANKALNQTQAATGLQTDI